MDERADLRRPFSTIFDFIYSARASHTSISRKIIGYFYRLFDGARVAEIPLYISFYSQLPDNIPYS